MRGLRESSERGRDGRKREVSLSALRLRIISCCDYHHCIDDVMLVDLV